MDGATDSAVKTPPSTRAAAGELAAFVAPNVLDAGVRLEGAGLEGTGGGPISVRREEAAPDAGGGPVIPVTGGALNSGFWPDEPASVGVQALALELPEALGPGVAPAAPGFARDSARAAVRALRVRFSSSAWARLSSKPTCISA